MKLISVIFVVVYVLMAGGLTLDLRSAWRENSGYQLGVNAPKQDALAKMLRMIMRTQ